MSIDRTVISQAITALASLEDVSMDPTVLAEDAAFLTLAFSQEAEYKAAIANTVKAMRDIVRERVSTSTLDGVFQGWESYHYQPKIGQGTAANMRIIFKREPKGIHVLGFGHRYIPSDLYRRVSALRNKKSK